MRSHELTGLPLSIPIKQGIYRDFAAQRECFLLRQRELSTGEIDVLCALKDAIGLSEAGNFPLWKQGTVARLQARPGPGAGIREPAENMARTIGAG